MDPQQSSYESNHELISFSAYIHIHVLYYIHSPNSSFSQTFDTEKQDR